MLIAIGYCNRQSATERRAGVLTVPISHQDKRNKCCSKLYGSWCSQLSFTLLLGQLDAHAGHNSRMHTNGIERGGDTL